MIHLKTSEEIAIMQEGGQILQKVMSLVMGRIAPGVSTAELDDEAQRLIKQYGAKPSFFNQLPGYRWALCTPVNDEAVHTAPSKQRILKDGDVLTVDMGVYYEGYHTDHAQSCVVGDDINKKGKAFLDVGKEALEEGIRQVKVGGRLGQVAQAIQCHIEKNGYHILKELTGHGIGKQLHEDPFVFNYVRRSIEKTELIEPGLVIAIEVIYAEGTEKIRFASDKSYSVYTDDGTLAACFEHTVAVTDKKVVILT